MILAGQVKKHVLGNGYYAATLTGAYTVVLDNGLAQFLDPGGAGRAVTLPSASSYTNVMALFVNTADAAEALTFNDASTTVVSQGEAAIFISDGSNWQRFALFGSSSGGYISALSYGSSAVGTIAAAGANQGTATAITHAIEIVTAADGAKGVVLPAAAAGLHRIVFNDSTSALLVYPASGDGINRGTNDAAVTVGARCWAEFVAVDADDWAYSDFVDLRNANTKAGVLTLSDGLVSKTLDLATGGIASLAAAGSAQGDAGAIVSTVAIVTGADGTKGVVLPAAAVGLFRRVYNSNSSNVLKVYPASGDDINDGTADVAISVPPLTTVDFHALDSATWVARVVQETRTYGIPLTSLRKSGALKDDLADTPGTSLLGLGDAEGQVLTGTSTDGGGTATATETAQREFVLPPEYVSGQAITVRVRAKVAANKQVAQTVDLVAKLKGDTGLGADICATAAQSLTTSYANYDFTITPTGLAAGDVLNLDFALATNDTGGANAGAPTISKIDVLLAAKP